MSNLTKPIFLPRFLSWVALFVSLCAVPAYGEDEPIAVDEQPTEHVLTRDILAHALTAELALEQDNPLRAWQEYYEAARTSGYAELAERAMSAAESAENEEAISKSKKLWNQLDPQNSRVLFERARDLFFHDKNKEAVAVMRRILADSDNPIKVLENLHNSRTFVASRTRFYHAYVQLCEPYAQQASVQLLMASVAASAKMRQSAKEHGLKAIALEPDNPHILIRGADYEYAVDPKAASKRLAEYLKEHPGNLEVRLSYTKSLLKVGDRAAVQQQLAFLENQQRSNARVMFVLGMFAEESGLLDKAELFYKRYLVLVAKNPDGGFLADNAYVRLGMVKLAQGDKAQAMEWLHKVESGDKYHPARLKEAELLAQAHRIDEACSVLKSLRTRDNNQKAQFLQTCAELLLQDGREAEAVAQWLAAVHYAPDNAELLYVTAMHAVEVEQIEDAARLLEQFIALEPDNPNGYNALGYLWLVREMHMDKAATYIEKAMELSEGKDPYIVDSLGWLRYRQGNLQEAETLLRRAQNDNPSDVEIALHLAEVLFERGQVAEANGFIRSVLEGEPKNKKAHDLLRRYGLERGQ